MMAATIRTAIQPSTGTSSIAMKSTGMRSIGAVFRTFKTTTFRTRTPGHTTTTGPKSPRHSTASVDAPPKAVDLAAGRQELTVLAAGAACTPADSAVSMVSVAAGSVAADASLLRGVDMNNNIQVLRTGLALILLALITSLASCRKLETVAAGDVALKTFASPQEAGSALFQAAKSSDQAALIAIFGPDAKETLFSGDPVKDKNALKDFATAYETMHRWGKIKGGRSEERRVG